MLSNKMQAYKAYKNAVKTFHYGKRQKVSLWQLICSQIDPDERFDNIFHRNMA